MLFRSYPLYWPEGRPRTPSWKRQRSKFKTGFGAAIRLVLAELRRLGTRHGVVSTNVALRRDGLPLASAKRVEDMGVAIYFTYKDKQTCFACDRWDRVEDNIYAVAKTIEAMRGIARWGTGDMLDAAFTGFTAIRGPGPTHWRETLGIKPDAAVSAELIRARVRELAVQHHPDRGGNGERMAEINAAADRAIEELRNA